MFLGEFYVFYKISLNLCCLRVAQSACSLEECLGRTKVEVHIKPYGQVILVIGDVEGDYVALLALLFFYKRKDEAAILRTTILHLKGLLASIDDALPLDGVTIRHEEVDAMPDLHASG